MKELSYSQQSNLVMILLAYWGGAIKKGKGTYQLESLTHQPRNTLMKMHKQDHTERT